MTVHPCMMVGFAIALVGFVGVFVIMARRGGTTMGFQAWRNLGRFLRDPNAKRERRVFFGFGVVTGIGFAFMLGGVVIEDARQRGACREQCAAAGFGGGLVRGNPHAERPGDTPRMCWCRDGDVWADQPIAAPSP